MTTLRPLGPSVTLTASASVLTPRRIAAARVLAINDVFRHVCRSSAIAQNSTSEDFLLARMR